MSTRLTLGFLVPGLVALDLWAKVWARIALEGMGFVVVDLGPFFALGFVENTGISFGLLNIDTAYVRYGLIAVTAIMSLAVLAWLARTRNGWQRAAASLILAGAAGNLIDRSFHGGVTDFIVYRWFGSSLFVGNLADIWIGLGVTVLIFEVLFSALRKAQPRSVT